MDEADVELFDAFVEENWGKTANSNIVEVKETKRGRKPKIEK